jgi:hypothetical protein
MKHQTLITQKRRGPAPTGKGTLIGVRLQPDQLAAIDAWIAKQDEPPTRPEAIRHMVAAILQILDKDPGEKSARSKKSTSKASDMAAQQIDKLMDSSAPSEERQQRKRRLLKGPREFRDIRGDLPKPKR